MTDLPLRFDHSLDLQDPSAEQQLAVGQGSIVRRSSFALFLTHRRGAAVCVCDPTLSLSGFVSKVESEQLQKLRTFLSAWALRAELGHTWGEDAHSSELLVPFEEADCVLITALVSLLFEAESQAMLLAEQGEGRTASSDAALQPAYPAIVRGQEGIAFAISKTQSAEQLWTLYRLALGAAKMRDAQVELLVYAGGPCGSFTGLRIGASFVAGLACGRARPVRSVQTFDIEFLKSLEGACPWGLCLEVLETGQKKVARPQESWDGYENVPNQYQLPVLGIEVLLAFCLVLQGRVSEHSFSDLHYASEPGPVIALRSRAHPESERKM